MNWHTGQKVVCVKTPTENQYGLEIDPDVQSGFILTVSGARIHFGVYYLKFKESSAGNLFREDLFRPLESTYTEEEIEAVNIDELVQPELEPA